MFGIVEFNQIEFNGTTDTITPLVLSVSQGQVYSNGDAVITLLTPIQLVLSGSVTAAGNVTLYFEPVISASGQINATGTITLITSPNINRVPSLSNANWSFVRLKLGVD